MRLRRISGESCELGNCPAIYVTGTGDVVVQGPVASEHEFRLGFGEAAVEASALSIVDAAAQLGGPMTGSDLSRMFQVFGREAFRLETLPQYVVPDEADRIAAFKAGRPMRASPAKEEWLRMIAEHTAAGRMIRRVHTVRLPLSDYLRWEFAAQADSVAAGEDIRVADLDQHPDLARLDLYDYWMFDGSVIVRMVYDADGRFLRPERLRDSELERCVRLRDLAWERAVPLGEFVAGVS